MLWTTVHKGMTETIYEGLLLSLSFLKYCPSFPQLVKEMCRKWDRFWRQFPWFQHWHPFYFDMSQRRDLIFNAFQFIIFASINDEHNDIIFFQCYVSPTQGCNDINTMIKTWRSSPDYDDTNQPSQKFLIFWTVCETQDGIDLWNIQKCDTILLQVCGK